MGLETWTRGPSQPPELPAEYELRRELGRGSFGVVVLARHRVLDRLVAVKRISGTALLDPEAVARFQREGAALAAVRHPNVVEVYDLRRHQHRWLLFMAYVPGVTLRQLLQRNELAPSARLPMLAQLADAVATAHARGVLHRDIKPGNVIVRPDGTATLADFGLARLTDPAAFRTRQPTAAGTTGYMAPEVLRGSAPTAAADTFAFAVMAAETVTGRRPAAGDRLPGQPPALAAALSEDPRARPTMADLARGLGAAPTRRWTAPPALPDAEDATDRTVAGPVAPPRESPAEPAPDLEPRRRVLPIALALTATAAVAGFALVLAQPNPPLTVTSSSLAADPRVGTCPEATYRFLAEVRTNGAAGEVVTRWLQPDGTRTQPVAQAMEAGQGRLTATLRYVISGDSAASARAVFEIVQPAGVEAAIADVAFLC